MLRTFDIILIGLMITAAAVTYKIKHDAENQMAQVNKLQRMITDEKDTIDLLKADWSLLTQPNRSAETGGVVPGPTRPAAGGGAADRQHQRTASAETSVARS